MKPHVGIKIMMVALGLCAFARGMAIDIVGFKAGTFDRFVPGTYPSAPVENRRFRWASLDWSGVGWNVEDPRKSVAMISPKHFVAANQFAISGQLAFLMPDGRTVICPVASTVHLLVDPVSGLVSDLYVGELVEPLDPGWGIAAYPILDPARPEAAMGQSVLLYGIRSDCAGCAAGASVGVNTFEAFRHMAFGEMLWYSDQDNSKGEALGQASDAGCPTFVLAGSRLAIVGVHYGAGKANRLAATIEAYVPNFIEQLSDIVSADGYTIESVEQGWGWGGQKVWAVLNRLRAALKRIEVVLKGSETNETIEGPGQEAIVRAND